MKSYGVTIQMKPLQQYFHMVLIIQYEVLTFDYVNEILWGDHSNATSLVVLSLALVLFTQYVALTFESVDQILCSDHSNDTFLVVLTHSIVYLVCICSYNFGVWYYLFSTLSYNF